MEPIVNGPRFSPPASSRPAPAPRGRTVLRHLGRALSLAVVAVLCLVPFLVITYLAVTGRPMMFVPVALILLLALAPVLEWREERRQRRRREDEPAHREAASRRPCRQCGATRPAPVRGPRWRVDAVTVARSGWAVGAVPGVVVALALAASRGLFDAADGGPGPALGAAVVGAIVIVMPIGAVAGAVPGVLAQSVARGRLEARGLNWRPCTNSDPSGGDPLNSPFWAQRYDRCLRAALRFRAAVDAVEAGTARNRLVTLGDDVDRALQDARQVAVWGQDVDAAPERGRGGTAPPGLWEHVDHLDAVAHELEEMAERAAAVTVSLTPEVDLARIREQLDMISTQAPLLSPPPRADA